MKTCPRCECKALEEFVSSSLCYSCNYSPYTDVIRNRFPQKRRGLSDKQKQEVLNILKGRKNAARPEKIS